MSHNRSGKRTRTRLVLAALGLVAVGGSVERATSATASADQIEFFETKVRPVLSTYCYSCHSSQVEAPFAGLRLDSREAILRGGDSGAAISIENPDESSLVKRLRGEPVLMPPTGRLSDEDISEVVEWIRMGAPWPAESADTGAVSSAFDLEARRKAHWAWQPVRAVTPPAVKNRDWPSNPIDRFVLAKLEANELEPAPPADRQTLIRRLYFDLIGLPPTPGESEAFLRDQSPDAYARLVRQLLDSDRFGEHWARHWMDLVRYADSHGSEGDPAIPDSWQYRDYLIRALNSDTPYDQLIREHIAGDLLESPRIDPERRINESILGTGHLRLGELGYQPVDPWGERLKWADNQIDVLSKAFQGLTVSCARCHDHKFDAISQEDYYALFGVLYGARPTMRTIDSDGVLELHSAKLAELKRRIREAVAEEWISAGRTIGNRLQDASSDAVRMALEEAACDESSPLNAWMELRDLDGDQVAEAWRGLQAFWRKQIDKRLAYNEQKFKQIWDLSGADFKQWIVHGAGGEAEPSPPGEFHVTVQGSQALQGIYPGGAYTHLLSSKHAGVMQSPRFKIDSDYVSVRVLGGDFSFARLIIENYSLPLSGIYHQRYSPRSDTMRWWQWKTDFWKGFTGYVEFATRDDATNFWFDPVDIKKKPRPARPTHGRSAIGASAVAFHNGSHTPKAVVEPISYFLDADAPDSAAAVLRLLGDRLVAAAEAWRDGRLDERQAAFLDYFVRRDLLPRSIADLKGVEPMVADYRRLEAEVPVARRFPGVVEEASPDQPLLVRGDPNNPGVPVPRRFLEALHGANYPDPGTVRMRLAEDLASPSNPLTARVMANRIWQHVFGRGIVSTPDNFGRLGEPPSHPELLDYIAGQFVDQGWSMKRLIELLVTSSTYRMDSTPSARALEIDPLNAWLQHIPVRRLKAEAIRDTLLAVSGNLDLAMFGAYPKPRKIYGERGGSETSPYGDNRRSVYQEVRRNRTNPFLEAFDQPTPSTTRGERDVTNVPAQSLAMMNSPFVVGAAKAWGKRLAEGEGHSLESRVQYMYRMTFGRMPTESELRGAKSYAEGLAEEEAAGQRDVLSEPKVWSRLAHTLFNFKEFLYVR